MYLIHRGPFLFLSCLALFLSACPKSEPAPPTNVDLAEAGAAYRSFTPATVPQGQTFDVSIDVENLGTVTSGSFIVRFYLSENTIISPVDFLAGQVNMLPLAGGARTDCDLSGAVTTTLSMGTYNLGWIIDAAGTVAEDDESNNTGYMATVLTIGPPDTNLVDRGDAYSSFTPGTLFQGDTLSVSCDVSNSGTVASGTFTVTLHASLDNNITSDDYLLGTVNMPSIAGGAFATCTLANGSTSAIPGGTYYVGWIIDTTFDVSETNETDNRAYDSGSLTILPAGVDLLDDGESFRSFSPVSLKKSEPVAVSCQIYNAGNTASAAYSVSFYASSDASISAGDYFLGSVSMGALAAGSTATCNLAAGATDGIPIGLYNVGWIIDEANAIAESNETNNVAYKTGYQLTINSATYTATTFTKGMTSVFIGSTMLWDGTSASHDDLESNVSIGFTFKFFGTLYTSCKVGTNGYITFSTTTGDGTVSSNDAIPNSGSTNALIALFWDDLIVANNVAADQVYYRLDGTAGSRVLTIEYYSVTRLTDNSSYLFGQIKLYESTNVIELCYDPGNWGSLVACSIGIEDETGLLGYEGPTGSPSITTEPTTNFRFSHD